MSTSDPYMSPVFASTGFGNSVDPKTGCVSTGPFREGKFEVTSLNGSSGCLTREYNNYTFFGRGLLESSLSLGANMFKDFHNFVQLFLTLNIRCFIGGEMCSANAASDPLYPLHLARVDLFIQKWQKRDKNNTVEQRSNRADPLVLTLDKSLLTSDFCSNDELTYGTCVTYAPLGPMGDSQGQSAGTQGQGSQCVPVNRLNNGTGVLISGEARLYLSRTCSGT